MGVNQNHGLSRENVEQIASDLSQAADICKSAATLGAAAGAAWLFFYLCSRTGGVGDLSPDFFVAEALPAAAAGIIASIGLTMYFSLSGLAYNRLIPNVSDWNDKLNLSLLRSAPFLGWFPNRIIEFIFFAGLSLTTTAFIFVTAFRVAVPYAIWPVVGAAIPATLAMFSYALCGEPCQIALQRFAALGISTVAWLIPSAIVLALSRPIEAEYLHGISSVAVEAGVLSLLIVLAGSSNYRIAVSGPLWLSISAVAILGVLVLITPRFVAAIPFTFLGQGQHSAEFVLQPGYRTLLTTINKQCSDVKLQGLQSVRVYVFSSLGTDMVLSCTKNSYIRLPKTILGPEIGDRPESPVVWATAASKAR
jgi:hypothetical protein